MHAALGDTAGCVLCEASRFDADHPETTYDRDWCAQVRPFPSGGSQEVDDDGGGIGSGQASPVAHEHSKLVTRRTRGPPRTSLKPGQAFRTAFPPLAARPGTYALRRVMESHVPGRLRPAAKGTTDGARPLPHYGASVAEDGRARVVVVPLTLRCGPPANTTEERRATSRNLAC